MYIEENDETEVIIPEGVKHIADEAFRSCRKLESIIIPNGVTEIGFQAFYHCGSLRNVTIPSSVTTIGKEAFDECPELILNLEEGSPAEEYCKTLELPFTYTDSLDWLND